MIGTGIAFGVSFFILYTRKKKWMSEKRVWLICIVLFIIGLSGLFLKLKIIDDKLLFFGLCVPFVYWIFDRIFKRISENIHQRDFILYLRGSDEINNGLGAKNPHVKSSDILFSFGLLVIIISVILIGTRIIK